MLKGVKIMVVDNFQGEENDIILLSLVRSNREAKIGFLRTENRVCVALSRAKMGFYIIGMCICNVISPVKYVLYSYINTFCSMCALPSVAVFFFLQFLNFVLSWYVAQVLSD